MKLNYIDHDQVPVSVMFVADEIKMICEFFKLKEQCIKDFKHPYALESITNTFHEINKELIMTKGEQKC